MIVNDSRIELIDRMSSNVEKTYRPRIREQTRKTIVRVCVYACGPAVSQFRKEIIAPRIDKRQIDIRATINKDSVLDDFLSSGASFRRVSSRLAVTSLYAG